MFSGRPALVAALGVSAALALALAVAPSLDVGTADAAQRAAMVPGPYFSARFSVEQNSYTFGQDPTWTRRGDVLSQELGGSGILQVYRSKLDGSARYCVTCGKTRGPNGFAAERPQGGWILFCSYGAQPEHLGMPCLGGYGACTPCALTAPT
jgi:hypothetical protein